MKNLLYLFIPLLLFSCMNVESKVDVNNNKVVIVEFGDLTSLSDDKQYGNFEIKVPEIDNNVMQNGAVLAYIERAATDVRPQRWSLGLIIAIPLYTTLKVIFVSFFDIRKIISNLVK